MKHLFVIIGLLLAGWSARAANVTQQFWNVNVTSNMSSRTANISNALTVTSGGSITLGGETRSTWPTSGSSTNGLATTNLVTSTSNTLAGATATAQANANTASNLAAQAEAHAITGSNLAATASANATTASNLAATAESVANLASNLAAAAVGTITGYGDIVTHDANEFLTSGGYTLTPGANITINGGTTSVAVGNLGSATIASTASGGGSHTFYNSPAGTWTVSGAGVTLTSAYDSGALHTIPTASMTFAAGSDAGGQSVTNFGTISLAGPLSLTVTNAILTPGGFSAGVGAETILGAAVGNVVTSRYGAAMGRAAWTMDGGAIGYGAYSSEGGAVGTDSYANQGGAVGYTSSTDLGGAVGYLSKSTQGGAVGAQSWTEAGFAGGFQAQCTTNGAISGVIDAIQLGTGVNTIEHSTQFYTNMAFNPLGFILPDRVPTNYATASDGQIIAIDKTNGRLYAKDDATGGGGAVNVFSNGTEKVSATTNLNFIAGTYISSINVTQNGTRADITINAAEQSGSGITNGSSGVTLSGTFSGGGEGLTNATIYSLRVGSSVAQALVGGDYRLLALDTVRDGNAATWNTGSYSYTVQRPCRLNFSGLLQFAGTGLTGKQFVPTVYTNGAVYLRLGNKFSYLTGGDFIQLNGGAAFTPAMNPVTFWLYCENTVTSTVTADRFYIDIEERP